MNIIRKDFVKPAFDRSVKETLTKKGENMSSMILKGKIHKFGSNVNTDEIIPPRYLHSPNPEFAKYCFRDIDRDFADRKQAGDIIVAQDNFGWGSSREYASMALKAAGISAVIAASFSRLFFRNSINLGLPVLESQQAAEYIESGDEVEIELNNGIIRNITKGESYPFQKYPEFMQKIIAAGGLLNYIKK